MAIVTLTTTAAQDAALAVGLSNLNTYRAALPIPLPSLTALEYAQLLWNNELGQLMSVVNREEVAEVIRTKYAALSLADKNTIRSILGLTATAGVPNR